MNAGEWPGSGFTCMLRNMLSCELESRPELGSRSARPDDIPQRNEYHASQGLSPASSLLVINQRAARAQDSWSTLQHKKTYCRARKKPGEEVTIEAREQEKIGDVYKLRGNVVIHFRNYVVQADDVTYNDATGDVDRDRDTWCLKAGRTTSTSLPPMAR